MTTVFDDPLDDRLKDLIIKKGIHLIGAERLMRAIRKVVTQTVDETPEADDAVTNAIMEDEGVTAILAFTRGIQDEWPLSEGTTARDLAAMALFDWMFGRNWKEKDVIDLVARIRGEDPK